METTVHAAVEHIRWRTDGKLRKVGAHRRRLFPLPALPMFQFCLFALAFLLVFLGALILSPHPGTWGNKVYL